MPCYYPIAAVQASPGAPLQLFGREQKHLYRTLMGRHLEVPCGQCSGCRRRRSLEWAMRCMHEAQQHQFNSYITLTYREDKLPQNNSLQHRDYVLFMKKLRNKIESQRRLLEREWAHDWPTAVNAMNRNDYATAVATLGPGENQNRLPSLLVSYADKTSKPIKFYMAGEYGETHGRPHYHAILFGIAFRDQKYFGRTKAGEKIYTSPTLEQLWEHGYSSIGKVTFNSAAYISRYVMKKRTGDGNIRDYEILDLTTGELIYKRKEYNCMSRNPGIGKTWFDQYKTDVYTTDKVVTKNGRTLRPPRYYDKQLKQLNKAQWEGIKHARELEALAHAQDHTPERLAVQETVANAKARTQTRNLPG